jgi:hypothetical protein
LALTHPHGCRRSCPRKTLYGRADSDDSERRRRPVAPRRSYDVHIEQVGDLDDESGFTTEDVPDRLGIDR